jgi:N-methylhydantoinase A
MITGRRAPVRTNAAAKEGSRAPAARGSRLILFDSWTDTPVYRREDLVPGTELYGPLVVEQSDTTAVIEPGMHVRVDDYSNLVVTL